MLARALDSREDCLELTCSLSSCFLMLFEGGTEVHSIGCTDGVYAEKYSMFVVHNVRYNTAAARADNIGEVDDGLLYSRSMATG